MRTHIKYNRLPGLPEDKRQSALKQAIDHELGMVGFFADLFGDRLRETAAAVKAGTLSMGYVEERIKAALQTKYSTASDNPILVDLASEFASFFHSNMPELDTGYLGLFDLVDMRGSTHDHFDIVDTNAGITYEQIAPGAAIKKRTAISESRTQVPFLTYGAGLGLLDDWLSYQQFWKVDEAIGEFRAKYFDTKASLHYGLLTALGSGIDVAFATDDATTFNSAAAAILRNVRSSGYAVGQNAALKIVTSPEQVGRVKRMLEATSGSTMLAFGTMKQPIAYQVDEVIASTYIAANDTGYYLVLPRRKLKRGEWRDLGIEQQRNASARATDWYASGQFNAVVGDSNQVRRVKFA